MFRFQTRGGGHYYTVHARCLLQLYFILGTWLHTLSKRTHTNTQTTYCLFQYHTTPSLHSPASSLPCYCLLFSSTLFYSAHFDMWLAVVVVCVPSMTPIREGALIYVALIYRLLTQTVAHCRVWSAELVTTPGGLGYMYLHARTCIKHTSSFCFTTHNVDMVNCMSPSLPWLCDGQVFRGLAISFTLCKTSYIIYCTGIQGYSQSHQPINSLHMTDVT